RKFRTLRVSLPIWQRRDKRARTDAAQGICDRLEPGFRESDLTLFDIIVIGVLLVSSVLALLRGFTNEVLSILAWVVGALAALWLFPYLTPVLRGAISPPW
ncbi:MAG TPA: hypothetical protein DIT63_04205, partial [Gammaproteobacteria bacterium]|nr:hypothetical protein [Gammaproteobacteria bacterium]